MRRSRYSRQAAGRSLGPTQPASLVACLPERHRGTLLSLCSARSERTWFSEVTRGEAKMRTSPMFLGVVVCCLSMPHAFCFAPSSSSSAKKLGRPEGLVALASSTVVAGELDTSVEFPPPLTKMERLQRAAQFWSSALPIVLVRNQGSWGGFFCQLTARVELLQQRRRTACERIIYRTGSHRKRAGDTVERTTRSGR